MIEFAADIRHRGSIFMWVGNGYGCMQLFRTYELFWMELCRAFVKRWCQQHSLANLCCEWAVKGYLQTWMARKVVGAGFSLFGKTSLLLDSSFQITNRYYSSNCPTAPRTPLRVHSWESCQVPCVQTSKILRETTQTTHRSSDLNIYLNTDI